MSSKFAPSSTRAHPSRRCITRPTMLKLMQLLRFCQFASPASWLFRKMSTSGMPLHVLPSPLRFFPPSPPRPSGLLHKAACCLFCFAFAAFTSSQSCPGRHLDAVIVEPTAPHTATMIFLHGLGDSGHGWSQADWNLPHAKLIFPNAPSRPITVNGGARMPGW
jgi:hypothetical protein